MTINLYQKGNSTVFETAKTGANGNYSFSNLPAGSYSLQQVVPSGYLATGGLGGYSVSLASGKTVVNQNFDDFKLLAQPSLSNLCFIVTTPGGKSTTVTTLDGNVQQGDTVRAKFDLKTAEQMTLVAYTAPNGDFDTSNLQQQVIFSEASTSGGTGTESLTVTVPDGYFQIDFVAGPAIDHLETNPNITYHAQSRFITGDQGGSHADAVSMTAATSTVMTSGLIASTDVASPTDLLARKH